jgi:hypothetical protein
VAAATARPVASQIGLLQHKLTLTYDTKNYLMEGKSTIYFRCCYLHTFSSGLTQAQWVCSKQISFALIRAFGPLRFLDLDHFYCSELEWASWKHVRINWVVWSLIRYNRGYLKKAFGTSWAAGSLASLAVHNIYPYVCT